MQTKRVLRVYPTRRTTLAALARAGAAALFIPAWNETMEAADTLTCVSSTPSVTEGPYWVDEKLFRSDIRTDPSTGVVRAGVPLTLTILVQNLASGGCSPLAGAYVDVWHCDAKGIYSDEASYNPGGGTGVVTTTGQKFLRGYQIADANGQVQFTTIYPGWYSGRTIHIHVRVRTYSGATVLGNFVSQIFFDDSISNVVLAQAAYSRSTARDTVNSSDMVYNVANQTRMLASVTGSVDAGYAATITMGVSLATPAAAAPLITAGGVGNAFSGAAGVSPNS
jgi:protocatechuate 3,4-dioxygenase beta subunit